MTYDYKQFYFHAMDKQYGAESTKANSARNFLFNDSVLEKDKLPEYLHGLYEEIAKLEGSKSEVDTVKEKKFFHQRACYTIDRNKVPSNLLNDYDKIAKANNNNIIDTELEARKFQDKVESVYNYGEISLDMVKEMGFSGHRTQGDKTSEYYDNGFCIVYMCTPVPIIRYLTGFLGGIVGGAIGLICDGIEFTKEKCLGKQNNDLIGISQNDCSKLHDKFVKTVFIGGK